MLVAASADVAECLEKAARARTKAKVAIRPDDKQFWQEMESKWTRLAESYAQVERMKGFIGVRLSVRR